MNKFNNLYKIIMEEVCWNGSSRSEMAEPIIRKMSTMYPPTDYVFIEGSDDWEAPAPWRVANLPSEFVVDKFQTGFSKYGNNTIVIRKADLETVKSLLKDMISNITPPYWKYNAITIIHIIPEIDEIQRDILYKAASDGMSFTVFDGKSIQDN